MKRIPAFLLSIFMLSILLCACSRDVSQLSPDNPVTLTLWHVYGSQTESPLNDLVQEFNTTIGRERGVIVEVTSVTNSSDIDASLIASAQNLPGAARLPDLFTAYPRMAEKLGEERLMDWQEYISKDELAAYMPEFLAEGMFGERLLMLPIAKSAELCFLNATIFERFAADSGALIADMTDFERIFELCPIYYKWSGGRDLFQINDFYHYFIVNMTALGEDFVKDGRVVLYGDTFERVWKPMARAGIRGGLCVGDGYASDRWKTAEVISNIGSTAGILYLRDYVTYEDNTTEPIRTLILPYPAFYGGAPTVMQRGTGLFAMASDDERRNRAAAMFAVWMTCGQSNSRFAVQTGYLPVTQKGFAELLSNSDTLENEKYRLLYDTVGDMYDDYAFCSQPRYEGAADVQAALEKNVKRVLSSAHAEYDKRVMLGGDAHSIADELERRALDELRGLMQ